MRELYAQSGDSFEDTAGTREVADDYSMKLPYAVCALFHGVHNASEFTGAVTYLTILSFLTLQSRL